MQFIEIVDRITPALKKITRQLNGHFSFFNDEDLFQEALLHLWIHYEKGELEGKNNSYLARSCFFYLKNYLRKNIDKVSFVNLDIPIGDTELTFSDIIPDNKPRVDKTADTKLLIEKIKNNGLSKREKEVFNLSLEGLTVREIGQRLNISHVRVVKLRNNIRSKYGEEFKA